MEVLVGQPVRLDHPPHRFESVGVETAMTAPSLFFRQINGEDLLSRP
jgi:hypothetical protein